MTRAPSWTARLRRLARGDETGSALVMTLLVMVILTGLGTTVFTISTRNLNNAQRDRQATAALADAEAGIGQAVAYLKSEGVGKLRCAPNCNAANPWGEQPSSLDGDSYPAKEVTLSPTETYQVWIVPIVPFNAAVNPEGRYRIHSVGDAGPGPGSRTVTQDVTLTPFSFPLAIYGDSIQAGGSGSLFTESLFSAGCIFKRSKLTFTGVDQVYDIPAAAHSSKIITDSQAGGSSCAETERSNIHAPAPRGTGPCNPDYPFDQDSQGADLSTFANACYLSGSSMPGSQPYPETSYTNNVAKDYGFQESGLTSGQLDALRTAAMEQGFYFTNSTAIPTVLQDDVTSLQYPNPVLFYDLKGSSVGGLVDLNDFSSVTYGRPAGITADDAACTSRNVIVVVLNGDVRLNSNQVLVASVFAMGPSPYGSVTKANGTSTLIGTLYARSIDLTGTANTYLDDCFLANLPGQLLNVRPSDFREVDR